MERILLKLSGTIFSPRKDGEIPARAIAQQIKTLSQTHQVSVVIGGGNFFRARSQGVQFGLQQPTADTIGMLATVSNGLMLHDFLAQLDVSSCLLSALPLPSIAPQVGPQSLRLALESNQVIIFIGGTGNPFFTTDTTAVMRSLQVGAKQLWKGTNVDYVYDGDPNKNKKSKALKTLTHQEGLDLKLGIMDLTAISLAQEYNLPIRVFNVFNDNALEHAANNPTYGSIITTEDK
ncbi:MAG: UMP kinase [Epsilonproteobacteria bacterium]|nr:UMP kinase [Campylobacterota bacterium]